MSTLSTPTNFGITAELTPMQSCIGEVHSHIVRLVSQVLNRDGYMAPHNRLGLDRELSTHFTDLRAATRLNLVTPKDADQAIDNLIDAVGIIAPREKKLAQAFGFECVRLAQIVLDEAACATEVNTVPGFLELSRDANLRVKAGILAARRTDVQNGSIIAHLGVVPNIQLIDRALEVSALYLQEEL